MSQIAKSLILLGLALALFGVVLLLGQKLGLGRLPGDLSWKGKHGTFHFPLATSVLVSLILTLLLNLWLRKSR
jgi:ribose/xylose/arabinose/galactoside ABC-type transport system permease subunit